MPEICPRQQGGFLLKGQVGKHMFNVESGLDSHGTHDGEAWMSEMVPGRVGVPKLEKRKEGTQYLVE
jgi:hypothetical protein